MSDLKPPAKDPAHGIDQSGPEWTTPRQVSTTILLASFTAVTQIITLSALSKSLHIAVACFAVCIPLSATFFLRPALNTAHPSTTFRRIHDSAWHLSVLAFVGGVTAMFWHFDAIFAKSFCGAICLAGIMQIIGYQANKHDGTE